MIYPFFEYNQTALHILSKNKDEIKKLDNFITFL
jgi:hypothetical protein